MQRWHDLSQVTAGFGPSVVTIGVFDGVHRGHQRVIAETVRLAGVHGARSVVMTIDPHPMSVVRPEVVPPSLSGIDRRLDLFERYGADDAVVLSFTQARSQQTAEEFVHEVVGALRPVAFVVGDDFRFGHKAAGDLALLERMGEQLGYTVEALKRADRNEAWSSSAVRTRLGEGDVAGAAEILGVPHRIEGVVVRGDRRGRELGIPTANVPVDERFAVPSDGVYAGWLERRGGDASPLPAVISVGTKPQFGEHERVIEAHVLDRDDLELYDEPVAIDFVDRIRGQARFDSVDELVVRMRADIDQARSLLVS